MCAFVRQSPRLPLTIIALSANARAPTAEAPPESSGLPPTPAGSPAALAPGTWIAGRMDSGLPRFDIAPSVVMVAGLIADGTST